MASVNEDQVQSRECKARKHLLRAADLELNSIHRDPMPEAVTRDTFRLRRIRRDTEVS